MDDQGTDLLYRRIAADISSLIEEGALRPGDRLPSVRRTSRDRRVSVGTVLAAYLSLEKEGFVEARPKSGHFVRRKPDRYESPAPHRRARLKVVPARVSVSTGVAALMYSLRDPSVLPLGSAVLAPELLPIRALNRTLAIAARDASGSNYVPPPGPSALRHQLARRALTWGLALDEDDFVTTVGATEAMHLCFRALTKPGDTVVVHSPMYFGVLQLLEELGLRVIEIPTHPDRGMDLDALKDVLKKAPVRACVAIPNFDNPLGSRMSDEAKERMVRLLAQHDVPLIEDDVYGDMSFDGSRPRPAKAFDRDGRVLLCSSVSKTLAAGYRVGWVVPGRYRALIERMQFSQTVATPTLPQLAVAEYLAGGGYDRHLRSLRTKLRLQVQHFREAIALAFPRGTSISAPQGGFVLWVEMPREIDALAMQAEALRRGVAIAPGPIFSARQRYTNAIRISCGIPWSSRVEEAIAMLGELAHEQMNARASAK
ncbi:PLP-dependent aminotransferase family protein [Pendulispora albinea]|uniref:PLP-dependent aminotransferase family protein n=1 Tax=Pendulispora albinea TaxID=2741071 RepID=A0ABZ2LPS2_9BACT